MTMQSKLAIIGRHVHLDTQTWR